MARAASCAACKWEEEEKGGRPMKASKAGRKGRSAGSSQAKGQPDEEQLRDTTGVRMLEPDDPAMHNGCSSPVIFLPAAAPPRVVPW